VSFTPAARFVVLEKTNMKKIGVLTVVVSLVLSLAAFGADKAGNKTSQTGQTQGAQDKGQSDVKGKGKGKAPDAATIEKELATLKAEHQAAMTELQDIKKLATDEGAKKTAGALDKLIARHEQEYQKRIAPIQKRLDSLKAAQKQGTDTQKDNATAPKKGGRKAKGGN
jgi:hypothetical protein